jgi:hypothetical protein
MWKNTFNPEDKCPKFLRDPSVNPATGRKIAKDGDVYKWLEEKCGGKDEMEKVAGKQPQRKKQGSGSKKRTSSHGGIRKFIKNSMKMPMGKFLDSIIENPEYTTALCKSFTKAQRETTEAVLPKIIFEFYGRKIMIATKGPLASKLALVCRNVPAAANVVDEIHDEEVELKQGENFCRSPAMKKIRSRQEFEPQGHQIDVQNFMRRNDRLMLFHSLGAGKSCSASMIMADYLKRTSQNNLIFFISPGGLRKNFTEEFCTFCPEDRRKLMDDDKYVGRIRLFSLDDSSLKKKLPDEFENCMVIIDEAHRLIDVPAYREGDDGETAVKNLEVLFEMLTQHQRNNKVKLVLMSGTPFPDTLEQHYNCLKLLKPNEMKISYEKFDSLFEVKEGMYYPKSAILKELYGGCISYYATDVSDIPTVSTQEEIVEVESENPLGEKIQNAMEYEDSVRAKTIDVLINKYMKGGRMDRMQARKQAILDKFRAATCDSSRRYSNFIYPRRGMTDANLFYDYSPEQILQMSPKLELLVKNLQDIAKCPGKQLIYCPFKETSGVNLIGRLLSSLGIRNLVYSGDVSNTTRSSYLQKFNSPENDNGDMFKVILITDAAAEGISLMTTRGMHLFNESIYASHMNQVIGRAIRFRSHARLPLEQRTVTIFRYRLFVSNPRGVSRSPDKWCYEKGVRRELLLREIDILVKTEWAIGH